MLRCGVVWCDVCSSVSVLLLPPQKGIAVAYVSRFAYQRPPPALPTQKVAVITAIMGSLFYKLDTDLLGAR